MNLPFMPAAKREITRALKYINKERGTNMNLQLEQDLRKCADMLDSWCVQNDKDDKATRFVYKTETLAECLRQIQLRGVSTNYALHRWYNYHTSLYCEQLFCDYGAIHDENCFNHDVDIYINGIPFDVKLTRYPKALSGNTACDLTTREGKDFMIRWMYRNQSQGSRKQMVNRLYVICDGKDKDELLRMKSDFTLLRKVIEEFMKSADSSNLNRITIQDNGTTHTLYSDAVIARY